MSCSSVHPSVCASQNIVNVISCTAFDTFSPNLFVIMHCVIIVITVFICTCFLIVFLICYSAISLSSRKSEIKLILVFNNAVWDRDERVAFWGQKVKGQGHSGVQYAGNSTFSFDNSILDDLALSYIHLVFFFCMESLQVIQFPKSENLGIVGERLFTGQISILSPNVNALNV